MKTLPSLVSHNSSESHSSTYLDFQLPNCMPMGKQQEVCVEFRFYSGFMGIITHFFFNTPLLGEPVKTIVYRLILQVGTMVFRELRTPHPAGKLHSKWPAAYMGRKSGPLFRPPHQFQPPPDFTIFPYSIREKERRNPYYQLVANAGFFSPFPL